MSLKSAAASLAQANTTIPEKGYFTTAQWAAKEGVSAGQARRLINTLTEAKVLSEKRFMLWVRNRLLPVPHFRLIK